MVAGWTGVDPANGSHMHYVSGRPLVGPHPDGMQLAMFGMGCFWGVERLFWQMDGVWVTAVGYSGGRTQDPTYETVCRGGTGHNEVVRIAFDPARVPYRALLATFWQSHDPTQGMRQGNDIGEQYRSAIYFFDEGQQGAAKHSRDRYQAALTNAGMGAITTEIEQAGTFFLAEGYHQQYLAKNPDGYCRMRGCGVSFR